jgi:hypothetical protein
VSSEHLIAVKRCSYIVMVLLMFLLGGAFAADEDKKEEDTRIRAKKPTVVTVEGTADPVQPDMESRSAGGKVGGAIKSAAGKTWKGIVGLTGWMFNTGEDIPSDRERREASKPRPEQQK